MSLISSQDAAGVGDRVAAAGNGTACRAACASGGTGGLVTGTPRGPCCACRTPTAAVTTRATRTGIGTACGSGQACGGCTIRPLAASAVAASAAVGIGGSIIGTSNLGKRALTRRSK